MLVLMMLRRKFTQEISLREIKTVIAYKYLPPSRCSMINMKKLMLYGGIEAESYKEIAGNIKEENKKCLRMYTALCSIVFLGLCAVTFFSKIGYVNRIIYLSAGKLNVVLFIIYFPCIITYLTSPYKKEYI